MEGIEILDKKNIMSLNNGTILNGYVFVREYSTMPTKTGGSFIGGNIECNGTVPFKVWSGPTFNDMNTNSYMNSICKVNAKVDDYNGTRSLVIELISKYDGTELEPESFFERKYNAEELWDNLVTILSKNVSNEAYQVFETLMTDNVKERFIKEFAAIYHHDNCYCGLIAHSLKVTRLTQIIKFYPTIQDAVDKDTLFVGAALHDIGKILEYRNGSITVEGKIMSHLTLGLFLVVPYKDRIIELKGKKFYEDLISIIQQHHNEFGERPRTLVAYIIHILDKLEAQLTSIQEEVANSIRDDIKVDDLKLSFNKTSE